MAIQLLKTKAGNSRCVIAFSAFNSLSSLAQRSYFPYTFYKILTDQSDCDVLFVGDESNSWYHGRIKGVEGSGIDNLKLKIRDLVADYDDIIVLGASMGGHAALHFHDCSWVNQIIALQPQLFIRKGWPRSKSCNLGCDVPSPNFKCSSNGPSIALIVGQLDLFDIYQAALFLEDSFACCATIVPNAYHNVCYHWMRLGVLKRAVNLFASGTYKHGFSPYGQPYEISQTPELEEHAEALPEINQFYEILYGGLGGDLESFFAAASLVDRFPNWESTKVAFGLLAARNGLFVLSHEYLASTSISLEDRYGPLSLYYYAMGDFSRFEQCLLESVKFNAVSPTDSFISRFLPVLDAPGCKSYHLRESLTLLGLADHFPSTISAASRLNVITPPTDATPDANSSRAVSEEEIICLGLVNSCDISLEDDLHCSLAILHGHYLRLIKLLFSYFSQKVSGSRCLDGQHESLMQLCELSLRRDAVNRTMNQPSLSMGSDGHPSLESFTALVEAIKSAEETLQQTQTARDEHLAKVKGLEGELTQLKDQQVAAKKSLQRLRQLCEA